MRAGVKAVTSIFKVVRRMVTDEEMPEVLCNSKPETPPLAQVVWSPCLLVKACKALAEALMWCLGTLVCLVSVDL